MISVLTITYQRYYLLEEAIESFIRQDPHGESEMVVINDSSQVQYEFNHPRVRIINVPDRFPTIAAKLEYGYKQCKFDYIYRLDDDDLLAPWALANTLEDIEKNPDYEIYRSNGHYFFSNNVYHAITDNINNGNLYTRAFLDRIVFPDKSGDEDADITFHNNAKIFNSNRESKTMIYRWGMGTYHISGWGQKSPDEIQHNTDALIETIAQQRGTQLESGTIQLIPHFQQEYYSQLPQTNTATANK